jgi:hypothetical protein
MYKIPVRIHDLYTNQPRSSFRWIEGFGYPAWAPHGSDDWLKENITGGYKHYEEYTEGVLDSIEGSQLIHYATQHIYGVVFDSPEDAIQFKLVWGDIRYI